MTKRCSSSRCSTEMVKGLHLFTLEKYSLCKGIGLGKCFDSDSFTVGGHKWAIAIYPDGTAKDKTFGRDKYEEGHLYFSPHVRLVSESDEVRFCFKMTLLDQSGDGDHWTASSFDLSPCVMATRQHVGFPCFMDQQVLQKSSYLKNDCLKIECTIGVVLPSKTENITTPSISVPRCDHDLKVKFLAMLKSGEGCDVVFNVGGQKFRAHKVILSARSSVFKYMLASFLVSDGKKELVIGNVEPRVFKVLLHFIYSDTLPEKERSLVDGYGFGPSVSSTMGAKLLEAADQYDVKRLKSICESYLWRSISLSRFAEIVSLAETCNASELKHLCFKYASDNYDVLGELGSFSYLQKKCPTLVDEVEDYVSIGRSLSDQKKMNTQVPVTSDAHQSSG